jgi:SET domain-containing protein
MKSKRVKIININSSVEEISYAVIPSVDIEEIIPKIKIYDCNDDGTYWYTKIGFNRIITSEER